jgi:hypothetical protein
VRRQRVPARIRGAARKKSHLTGSARDRRSAARAAEEPFRPCVDGSRPGPTSHGRFPSVGGTGRLRLQVERSDEPRDLGGMAPDLAEQGVRCGLPVSAGDRVPLGGENALHLFGLIEERTHALQERHISGPIGLVGGIVIRTELTAGGHVVRIPLA